MKRVLFSITGTVAGVVALLGYKSHGHALSAAGPLPSAGLSTTSAAPPAGSSTESTGTGTGTATPGRSSTGPSVNTPSTATGDAIETRYGIVQVKVTVGSGRIQNVQFVQLTAFDQRSAEINNAAAPLLLQETLQVQSAQVDSVSGATYTSDGYVQSLQSALDRAGFR